MKPSALRIVFFVSCCLLLLSLSPSVFAQTISVTSANPNNAPQGTVNLNVLVNGKNFKKSAVSKFYVSGTTDPGGISVNSTSFVSSSQLSASINVAANATATKFDVVVTLTDGSSGKGTQLFQVTVPDPAIAYITGNYSNLMVMNADGTNQISIFQPPTGTCVRRPNWSPDHSQLVFEMSGANCGSGIGAAIYVINKDGSGLRKVIAINVGDGGSYPEWSPAPAADGNWKIAFGDQSGSAGQFNLFLVNLDGTGLVNLTNSLESQYYPTWDRYATRLATQVYPCPPNISCSSHLYVFSLGLVNGVMGITSSTDLSASGPLNSSDVYQPEWARTQDKIALLVRPLSNVNNSALWIVSLADPANPVELTATYNTSAIWPSWSPDDSKIVFQMNCFKCNMHLINPDGTGLTDLGLPGGSPAWRRCGPTGVIACAP